MGKKINERGRPSVGGVPHADTSGQLGQPRRPWSLTGSSGGHSQSADSGHSSKLGRVNKGRDDEQYAYQVRFPENEEEPELDPKLKRKNRRIRKKISIDMRGRKAMPERKLTDDIDVLIENNEAFQLFLEDDRGSRFVPALVSVTTGVFGDLAANWLGFVPGVDLGLVAINLKQLQGNIDDGRQAVASYTSSNAVSNLQGAFYDELVEISDDLSTNLFDLLERAISAIPIAGDVTGILASVASNINNVKNLFKIGKSYNKGIKKTAIKVVIRQAKQLFSFLEDEDAENHVSNSSSMMTAIPVALDMLEKITDYIENYDAAYNIASDDYEKLSTAERQEVWANLVDNDQLFGDPPGGFEAPYEQLDEPVDTSSGFRSLISQILNEESESHDCEKEHPGKTCEEWEAELEEHSIGGYTGPMTAPANPKKFYKGMLNAYPGSNYVGDLPKSKA